MAVGMPWFVFPHRTALNWVNSQVSYVKKFSRLSSGICLDGSYIENGSRISDRRFEYLKTNVCSPSGNGIL